jgi:hypothetical protein
MDWQQDLDALIESTMAFAKDVKPRSSSDLTRVVRTAERALADPARSVPGIANLRDDAFKTNGTCMQLPAIYAMRLCCENSATCRMI